MILHAGLVALYHRRRWRGALIRGPSAAGKSDLAIRCLEAGFALVSDDRTQVWASGGHAYGRAPAALAGLIEHRGQAIREAPALPFARIALVVEPAGPDAERMPEPAADEVAGVALQILALELRAPSAPARVAATLRSQGDEGATDWR